MSPAHVLEPTYHALRRNLLAGIWPAGHRLEAARLADDLGVSITPVRDGLNRLTGERLVHSSPGEGFHVPRLDETELRSLIDWHELLLEMAIRRDEYAFVAPTLELTASYVERSAMLFSGIALTARNLELSWALANATARFGRYRAIEPVQVHGAEEELARLEQLAIGTTLPEMTEALGRYHDRRRAAAPALAHAARLA